jgi:uncharacterized protein YchJ
MSWFKNPFKKEEAPADAASMPGSVAELAADPKMKGVMGTFFRKWKDPAFLKQLRVLAGHMQKDGVDIKDMKAVQAWLEKNKERVEKGDFKEEAAAPGVTVVNSGPQVGRNDPCHCGSGKKFKKCHGA